MLSPPWPLRRLESGLNRAPGEHPSCTLTSSPKENGLYFGGWERGRNINLDSHLIQLNKFQMNFVNEEPNVKIKILKTKMES